MTRTHPNVDGPKAFFQAMAGRTEGSFNVQPISVTPIGAELLVVHVRTLWSWMACPWRRMRWWSGAS